MQRRIRSIQLLTADASRHFDCAESLVVDSESIPNLLRVYMLLAYRLENILLENSNCDLVALETPRFPQVSRELLDEYPELWMAIEIRKRCHGIYLILSGQSEEARDIFRQLVDQAEDKPDSLAFSYLGMACSLLNLQDVEGGLRYLGAVELAINASEWLNNRVHCAGRM